MIKKLFSILLLLIFIGWCYILFSDYSKVKEGNKAKHCIKHTIYEYEDGSVKECTGLGYKVYYYNRESVNVKTEFGPFWMSIKE